VPRPSDKEIPLSILIQVGVNLVSGGNSGVDRGVLRTS
jgi:hypothetical protein